MKSSLSLFWLALVSTCVGLPKYDSRPFAKTLLARQEANITSDPTLEVDLGYSVYRGYNNQTTGLNNWLGVRFAAPPTGPLRWQAPQVPEHNRSSIIEANTYAPICYQSGANIPTLNVGDQSNADEDCLFLNIQTPANATGPLPVFVWIHGGGYGLGSGRQDLSTFINTNNNTFVGVALQYRLGAFGFLSSDEVYRNGVANAGLYDQFFALQWIQSHIHLFGGNASMVTIAGESAGAGSVMLQDMAYGGSLRETLFTNTIAASPYLPMQYGYKDWIPSQSYYSFATLAGCPPNLPYAGGQTIFECLLDKPVATLVNASAVISASSTYGTWGFLPVTDGLLVQDTPSRQLRRRAINGQNALIGNNANEGPLFTPQNISTVDDLVNWLYSTFPLFSDDDISKILLYYPSSNQSGNPRDAEYATSGYTGATALNVSEVGEGQQQRANNIYAETTFVCPSYWMAEAYSGYGRTSYKYQYSIIPGLHGQDVAAYFNPPTEMVSDDFSTAFKTIYGRFITTGNPSISNTIANGMSSNSTVQSPASDWPAFHVYAPYQVDLNQTGGVPTSTMIQTGINVTELSQPGLMNNFTLHNAYTWEGGRGVRCDFWRAMGDLVPE